MASLGECPKCGGAMKAKVSSFNPFGLIIPLVGCIERVAKCSKCGHKPDTWNGEPNLSRLTDIRPEGK
jgi:ssDNA-binding Zn-finger/Zn-ribbon topoisomerase 1